MKTALLLNAPIGILLSFAVALSPIQLFAANDDLKAAVSAAAMRLADQASFSWQTSVQAGGGPVRGFRAPGSVGGDPTTGQTERDGYTSVVQPGLRFVAKAGKAAVFVDDFWMTLDQAVARTSDSGQRGPGQFNPAVVSGYQLPTAQVKEYLNNATDFKSDGDTVAASLGRELVTQLLGGAVGAVGGRGGGGRAGRGGGPIANAKGSVIFWIKDGLLTKFSVTLAGTRDFRAEPLKLDRTTTTSISGIGTTKTSVAPDAKEIVDALVSGTSPKVFIPEPGFTRLFNGRDLTGWAGRPEHWSVEDGAIVGRTTAEKPARGNNFLIAKVGDKNLIVDDFELRFSYKISGSGNSGVQYRSKERDNFVVAGYQADFDGAQQFSGILYDEAGGAGGRGIMA
ncbi:MAG TPA: DUF1080 domain-containing protein, partial [Pirellulaceae bacterium]|nr:DUF1080 domain-containing protein [Pirellulaceae bacterium]